MDAACPAPTLILDSQEITTGVKSLSGSDVPPLSHGKDQVSHSQIGFDQRRAVEHRILAVQSTCIVIFDPHNCTP